MTKSVLCGKQAFPTVKDHTVDFFSSHSFRLINPTKTELGIVSQRILQKICDLLRITTQANQGKRTSECISLFHGIENKDKYVFIKYDIKDFYIGEKSARSIGLRQGLY